MNDRERLIELLVKAEDGQLSHCYAHECHKCPVDKESEERDISCEKILFADFLVTNGVTVQKHGRWEESADGDGNVCSVCGEDFCNIYLEIERFNYCPNCGAKMDLES